MNAYIALVNYTEQGITAIKDFPDRADLVGQLLAKAGAG